MVCERFADVVELGSYRALRGCVAASIEEDATVRGGRVLELHRTRTEASA